MKYLRSGEPPALTLYIYIFIHTHRHTMLVSQIPVSFPRFELTETQGAAALGAVHPASCVFNDDSEICSSFGWVASYDLVVTVVTQ